MTKKRFIIIGDSNIEFIMQTQLLLPIYDDKKRLSLKECCDLLNDLYEENQHLESHLNMVREVRDDMKKENEQLKEELKELKIDNEAKDDAIDGLQLMMAHYNLEDLE